jgi:hypothetical protein
MRLTASIIILGLAASGSALAQTSGVQPGSPPPPSSSAPSEPGAVPLSKDLSHSDGVVHPTATVDPGMSKTPPDPGPQSTPVIPPPTNGSTVVPK